MYQIIWRGNINIYVTDFFLHILKSFMNVLPAVALLFTSFWHKATSTDYFVRLSYMKEYASDQSQILVADLS